MDIITINENDNNFQFVCNSRSTRNGFAHDCNLLIDGIEKTDAHCYYYNRTWERWCYQSVCLEAINNLIDEYIERKKTLFMEDRNYKKLTAKRKKEFDEMRKLWPYLKVLEAVKANLNDNLH